MSDEPVSPITGKSFPKSENYIGGCHCGRISFTVKLSPPLSEMPVTKCNCSICHINGQLMVYPMESQITWHSGPDGMTGYTFGAGQVEHSFCPVCGTSVLAKSTDPGAFANHRALNVRTFRGVDLDSLKIRQVDNREKHAKEFSYDASKHPHNGYGPRVV